MPEETSALRHSEVEKTVLTWNDIIEAKAKKLGLMINVGTSEATDENRIATYQQLIDMMPENKAVALSPEKVSAKIEFDHSIKQLKAGYADPFEVNIGGVYPTLLTESEANNIEMEGELLLALINHLLKMNALFRAHPERTRIISILSVKLRTIPGYANFKEKPRFYTPTPA